MDLTLRFHKYNLSKTCLILILLIVSIFFLSACSAETENEVSQNMQEPTLPLVQFEGEFLYGEIPKPETVNVFALATSTDEEYEHYSFTFENFPLQKAKDYVSLLEEKVIKERVAYDIYEQNDFPVLNYFAYLEDGNSISLSQCNTSGEITINVQKSK